MSDCKQKDFPLGFPCPLCREFVPSPGHPNDIRRWKEKFPINDTLGHLIQGDKEINVCWACKRENEEEEAEGFCLSCKEPLCKTCLKFHRKSLASINHEICQISEIGSNSFSYSQISIYCEKHTKSQIMLYCHDHRAPCCADCFTEEHRTCKNILTVKQAVENLQDLGLMKSLKQDIEKMKRELEISKKSLEENVDALDDASDGYTIGAIELKQEILFRINKVFDEYITDIAKETKKANQMLEKNNLSFSDCIDFLKYLSKLLPSANESPDSEENSLNYTSVFYRVKEKLEMISKFSLSEISVNLKSEIHECVKEIPKIASIGTIVFKEISKHPSEIVDIKKAEFKRLGEIISVPARVRGGTVLPNRNVLCTNNKIRDCLLLTVQNGNLVEHSIEVELDPDPWDVLFDDGVLYFSHRNQQTSHVQRFSADGLNEVGSLQVGKYCTGLAIIGDLLFAVSDHCCILRVNKNGLGSVKVIYQTHGKGLRYLTALADGILVCSNFNDNSVIAINELGNQIWTYMHKELKGSYGLDKDCHGNIYVAGKKSDNIHILSGEGTLLRIIGDIINPVFIKLINDSFTCFVVCQSKSVSHLKLYEFK